MSEPVNIGLMVNGDKVSRSVAPRDTLADFLRKTLELTGTHTGCEMGVCGACLVLMDGRVVHSCLTFAVQADGSVVETIEGLSERSAIADIQEAFHQRNALQCGFCTPGVLMTAYSILSSRGCPRARKFAMRCRATIAAAPAMKRSSMQSSVSRIAGLPRLPAGKSRRSAHERAADVA